MARRAFFSEGDWSQLFASLYFQQQQDIERLVRRAESRAAEEQAAADAETYDRWQKGEISDDEWLNYIRQRVEETAHDPEEQAEWRKTLREHEEAVEDNRAEFAFQNGGSIHQLIAHYEKKLAGLDKNSQRYREVVLRLNDLKDQRDADSLETGAEQLMNRIDRGQASLDDLLKFYRDHLRKLRPNSDLYKQVQDEIEKVSDEKFERQVGAELERIQYQFNAGQINGSAAGAAIRRVAERYRTSDPQRYYEYLNAALQYERAGGVVGGGGGGRRSGGGGGGGGGGAAAGEAVRSGRWTGGFATQADINATRAALNRVDAFNKQIAAGALEVQDIETGEVIPVTEAFLRELDDYALGLYDQLNQQYLGFVDTRGRHRPKEKEASQALEDRSNYVVRFAQPHNSIPVQRQVATMLQDTERVLQQAMNSSDPLESERLVAREAARWRRFVDGVMTEERPRPVRPGVDDDPKLMRRPVTPEEAIDPKFRMELEALPALFEGLLGVETPEESGPIVDQVTAAWSGSGFFDAQLAEGLANSINDIRARRIGLETGELTWGVAPDSAGNLHITVIPQREVMGSPMVDPNGNVVVERRRVPDVDYSVLGDDVQITEVYADINGRPTPILAPMVPANLDVPTLYLREDLDMPDGGVMRAGPISSREWDRLNQAFGQAGVSGIEILKANGKIESAQGIEGWYQVLLPAYTDSQGRRHKAQTWAFLPGVGWYRGTLPLRGIQRNPDGSLKLDDEGSPMIDRRGFAHRAAVPIPYEGLSPREMQSLWNDLVAAGQAPQFFEVGPDGSITDEIADFSDAYYDSDFAVRMEVYQRTRETWWDPFHRQRRMDQARREFEMRRPEQEGIQLRKRGITLEKVISDVSNALGIRTRQPVQMRKTGQKVTPTLPQMRKTGKTITTPKIQQPVLTERESEVNRAWVLPTTPPPPPRTTTTRTTTRTTTTRSTSGSGGGGSFVT